MYPPLSSALVNELGTMVRMLSNQENGPWNLETGTPWKKNIIYRENSEWRMSPHHVSAAVLSLGPYRG